MCFSKLNILIYLVIIAIISFSAYQLGYDRGLYDATKSSETASDILTINTKTVYMTVDGEKNFRIETKEVIEDVDR